MKRTLLFLVAAMVAAATPLPAHAAAESDRPARGERKQKADRPGRRGRDGAAASQPADVAALANLSIVLGRPTDRSVTASVLAANAAEGYIEHGTAPGKYTGKTASVALPAGKPVEVALERLQPDTQYYYRLRHRKPDEADFVSGPEHHFHTQRRPGSAFTFEIQGDSHPERPQQFDPALYAQTLKAAEVDHPDFYMTIGDDFSADRLRAPTADAVDRIYLNQRPFLGLVAQSCPLFLVNGNHEQAALCNLDGTADNVAVWAQNARNRYFPQPAPDGFYTGDAQPVEFIGPLRDYYAWTWGDALFVVIDPYWHSPTAVDNVFGQRDKGKRDLWGITLGEAQYQWLKKTLETSKATYKFIFAHHVLGTGRGGIERAGQFEWGGRGNHGEWEFDTRRPGWALPIHQLMAKTGVTIFFQGHDHVFARQELDGVVYQTLPEPADPNYTLYFPESYRSGQVLPNSGRVRVTVSPQKARVEYVRSYLPKDAAAEHPDGQVACSYEIPAPKKGVTRS